MRNLLAALVLGSAAAALAAEPDPAAVAALVGDWDRFGEIEALGPAALPVLAKLYEAEPDPARRRDYADVFYRLGIESPEAKRALERDLHTGHRDLRLAVQWALGRVSGDADVVPQLLAIMRDDPDALFRDKAACALAHDQIHLDKAERVKLLEGVIGALEDPKPQVRAIAIKVLQVHTGQNKGYRANAPAAERAARVAAWREWLETYRAQAL
jgi:hypothetical protein